MKKTYLLFQLHFFTFGLIFPTISFASTEPNDNIDTKTKEQLLKEFKDEGLINKNIRAKDIESIKEVNDPHNYKITPFLSGNEPTYTYWLQSGKAKYTKTSYGKWTNKGGAFHGPGNFSKTFTTSTSLSVSGGISKSGLKASLGKKIQSNN